MASETQGPNRSGVTGLVFVGCLMLGLAIGFLVGNVVAGVFIGLGTGFIGMAVARYVTGDW